MRMIDFGSKHATRAIRILAPPLLGLLVNCQGPALASTSPAIGMNLAPNQFWGSNAPFIDRFKFAPLFKAKDMAGKPLPAEAIATDANGYPLAMPAGTREISTGIQLDPIDQPVSHRYVLTYSGSASFRLFPARVIKTEPGRITFEYIRPNSAELQVNISAIDARDHPHDIHVVRDDQQALFAAGQVFNPIFLQKVRGWSTVRMMDWLNTNDSAPVDWAKRPTPASMSWTARGIPLEVAVRLANQAHSNLWLNVPTLADDNYVRHMAELVKAQLDPDRKAYFEYSNEVWNWGFKASHIAQHEGNRLWGKDANGDGRIDDDDKAENYGPGWLTWYGLRSAQVASVVKQVFAGADRKRVMTLLSCQTGWTDTSNAVLDGVGRAKLGTVAELFDAFAITTYFGGDIGRQKSGPDLETLLGWARGGEAGMAAAFAHLRSGSGMSIASPLSNLPKTYQFFSKLAAANKLKLVAYEGGAHLTAQSIPRDQSAEIVDFIKRLMNDPRMGDLYKQMIADFGAAGGSELVAYNDIGTANIYGYWGVLDSVYQDGSPRYDALKAAAERAHAVH
jgi:hypothetical protein